MIPAPAPPTGPPAILIVEDERIVAMDLQIKLERMGYRVVGVAHTGEDAVRAATATAPDLVLMDIHLNSGIDGVEAARIIRRTLERPVIYLTAYSTRDVVERAKVTEPFGYVLKPFADRELHVIIEIALYRHAIELQLQQQRQLLAATLASIGDGVVATDPAGLVTFLNPVAEAVTRWPLAEARGRTVDDVLVIVDEADGRPIEPPLRRAMDRRQVVPLAPHAVLIARDRTVIPVDDSAAPILDDAGRLLGGVMVFQDVTARRAAQRDAAYLAAIVSSSLDAIVGYSAEGRITSWNPAAERLLGYAPAEIIGRPLADLTPPERTREIDDKIALARTGKTIPPYETVRLRKDGTPVDVSVGVFPVRTTDGTVIGFAAIIRDITDKRRLEEQFYQAQKMEAVGRLAGGIAHDFNNVITVVTGYSSMLLDEDGCDESVKGVAAEILAAARRATGLTRQLLAFSRRHVIAPVTVNVNKVVEDAVTLLERLLGEDVVLAVDLAPDLPCVIADPGQLEQVLMNLAVNARDAMPRGGRLTVATANETRPEGGTADRPEPVVRQWVRLALTDTGVGIPDHVRARLFEPFFTTKEAGKGTGLGLAVVHGIVTQCGGHIGVESRPGVGTTMTIYLPAAAEGATSWVPPPQAKTPLARGTETVLVVEDDRAVRQVTVVTLQAAGYVVIEARGAGEALDVVARHPGPIHALVTDLIMPNANGRELADEVRVRRPGIRVLYMSGYFTDAVLARGVYTGTSVLLQKPFTPVQLTDSLRDVLERPPAE